MRAHLCIDPRAVDKPLETGIFLQNTERQRKWGVRHIRGANVQQPSYIFRLGNQQHIVTRQLHRFGQSAALIGRTHTGQAVRLQADLRRGQRRAVAPNLVQRVCVHQYQSRTLRRKAVAIGFHHRLAMQARVNADFMAGFDMRRQPLAGRCFHAVHHAENPCIDLLRSRQNIATIDE